jgi:tetratricopeptide (TPR) repeat protein
MATNSIIKLSFAFFIILMSCSVVSTSNNDSINAINGTSLDATIKTFLENLKDILFATIQILFSLLVFILLFVLARWLRREDNDIVILPFVVAKKDDEYNGEAVANLLISELQRIKQIHSAKYEGIKNEKLRIPPTILTDEKASLPSIGTIGIGSASISIGELILTIKHLFPGSNHRQMITGCLEDCGSKIKLTACVLGDKTYAWEVQAQKEDEVQSDSTDDFDEMTGGNKQEVLVSDLVRGLSFKIVYDISQGSMKADTRLKKAIRPLEELHETARISQAMKLLQEELDEEEGTAQESISSKTMSGFKYYTEALGNYQQYMLTYETKYLDLSSKNCIRAVDVEQNYRTALGLSQSLGSAYYNKGMLEKAEKMFSKAIEIDPEDSEARYNKGVALGQQGKYEEAIQAFDKAIDLNLDCGDAWSNKGLALYHLNKKEEAIKAFKSAIKIFERDIKINPKLAGDINSKLAGAWINIGNALRDLDKWDDAIQAFKKADETGYKG